jgi:hemerythrin
MIGFTHWKSQELRGIAVIEAQRCWLSELAGTLGYHLPLDSAREAVGECLTQLLSGLLQSLPSEEQAFLELGSPIDEAHLAEHNTLCLEVLELIKQHECGDSVGQQLLQRLQAWLGQHCEGTHRTVLH